MEPLFIEANGLRFAYLEARPEAGAGPLALCFHGFPDTAETWRDVLPRLAAQGYHAVAPFMRGYAPSEIPPDGDLSFLALGRDVLGLMDAFQAERAVLIGHDWGASAVYNAAAMDPARVSRLVALAIPPPAALRPSLRTLWGVRHFASFQLRGRAARQLRADDFAQLREIYTRWSPRWDVPDEELAAVRACFRQPGVVEAALGYYWSFFRASASAEARRLLRVKYTMPTLLLGGDADGALDASAWDHVGVAFDGPFDVQVIPGVGHFLQREQPEQVAEAIASWLGPAT